VMREEHEATCALLVVSLKMGAILFVCNERLVAS
jgi:hypothetical protein